MAEVYTEPLSLTKIANINVNDAVIVTHKSGLTERLPGILFCESACTCSTAAATQTKVVTVTGYEDTFLPEGARLNVTFTNANTYGDVTASTKTYPKLAIKNKDGTAIITLDVCDSRGQYAGSGCWNAGDMIIFKRVGNKALIQNSDIRQVNSGNILHADGSTGYTAGQVNSALTALNVKSITPTVTIPSRWGTYTLNYCKMQQVGNFYFCYGSIIVGADAPKEYLYLTINGGSGVNFDRASGWRLDSSLCVMNNTSLPEGMLYSVSNNSLWLKKNHSNNDINTEATTFTGTELAGKTVKFSFMASKIS